MARSNIQQFRAALADRANQSTAMRGYRALTRGAASDAAKVGLDWPNWPSAMAATSDWVTWQSATPASFAGWPEWKEAPARTEQLAPT